MAEKLLDLARHILELIGERDVEALIELAAPDVEWYSLFAIGEGGVYRGHEGIRHYMRDVVDAWDVGHAEIDGGFEVNDITVFVGRIRYRGQGSGVEGATPTGWVLKFRDGKLVRFRAFQDPAAAFEAVGLSE
jgi:ketosteroid isomerase-like protein